MHLDDIEALAEQESLLPYGTQTISSTHPFCVTLKGLLITSFGRLEFAYDSKLEGRDLCNMWGGKIVEVQDSLPEGINIMLAFSDDVIEGANIDLKGKPLVIPAFVNGSLHFLHSDDNLEEIFHSMGWQIRDQFGLYKDVRFVNPETVLLTWNPDHFLQPCWLFQQFSQAMTECTIAYKEHPVDHFFMICIQGPSQWVAVLQEFWMKILPVSDLQQVGYSFDCVQTDGQSKIRFFPATEQCPIPVASLRQLFFVRAFRTMIQHCHDPFGQMVNIKYFGRILWGGPILDQTSIGFLIQIVEWSAKLLTDCLQYRLVHNGRRITDEQTLQSCQPNKYLVTTLHAVPAVHGGGPSATKNQFRTQVKNALATILLQEGYQLDWVSTTIEKLIEQCGIKPLPRVTHAEGAKRLDELLDIIKTTDIDLPAIKPKQTSSVALGARTKRRQVVQPVPTNYSIVEGFLVNEDKSNVKQLHEFGNKASGAYLTSPQDAIPWLRSNDKLISDELGLLIIGEAPIVTSLKTQAVTIPCKDACTLVQFGEKQISLNPQDKHQITKVNSAMMAITLWKEDWGSEWTQIVTNPVAFVKSIGGNEEHIQSVWGRSFRNGKITTTPHDATSLQLHCMIKESSVGEFLGSSGFNGLWIIPKTEEGRPSSQYRLLWLPDTMDKKEAHVLAAKLQGTMGLVKGKNRLALRILPTHFDEAWKLLHPHEAIPEAITTTKVFKVESLPFGTTMAMLKEWAEHQPWRIRPFRAVGPRAWVVGAADSPPGQQLFFNSMPVLIRELPPRFAAPSNPIVAGPRPSFVNKSRSPNMNSNETQLANGLGGSDPWASWTGPKPGVAVASAPVARVTTGPIDNKFSKQEERMNQLESELKKIQEDQKRQAGHIKDIEKQAVIRDKENQKQLDLKLGHMKSDFEKTFTAALSCQSQQFDSSLKEIKQLLQISHKRKGPEDEDADMTHP